MDSRHVDSMYQAATMILGGGKSDLYDYSYGDAISIVELIDELRLEKKERAAWEKSAMGNCAGILGDVAIDLPHEKEVRRFTPGLGFCKPHPSGRYVLLDEVVDYLNNRAETCEEE